MSVEKGKVSSTERVRQGIAGAIQAARECERVIASKSDRPKLAVNDLERASRPPLTEEEQVDFAAARILKRYRPAFLELAK